MIYTSVQGVLRLQIKTIPQQSDTATRYSSARYHRRVPREVMTITNVSGVLQLPQRTQLPLSDTTTSRQSQLRRVRRLDIRLIRALAAPTVTRIHPFRLSVTVGAIGSPIPRRRVPRQVPSTTSVRDVRLVRTER